MKITKAIIAAAGYGTRFLPATKVIQKEMLPIIDKPGIQYLVEEAVASGINTIIIVTRAGSHPLEDHFDSSFEIENQLEKTNKRDLLKTVKNIPRLANFVFLRQTKDYPYGNATPLLVARSLLAENEPFVYMFGDDLVKTRVPAVKQLIDYWRKDPESLLVGAAEVSRPETQRYGIIKFKKAGRPLIETIIEKPEPDRAPSCLAQFGRFILNADFIKTVARQNLGKNRELWLSDALSCYAKSHPVIAVKIKGKWLTTGDPLHLIKATIEIALERRDLGPELRNYIKRLKV